MKMKRIISIVLISTFLMSLGGCARTEVTDSSSVSETSSENITELSKIVIDDGYTAEPPYITSLEYEFNPHIYVEKFAPEIPQDYWESFYNLCDALRAGEPTFECSSQAAYNWATDSVTLGELFPAACVKVKGVSNDGTIAYENGVGRIYYQIPVEEFVQRQSDFEVEGFTTVNGKSTSIGKTITAYVVGAKHPKFTNAKSVTVKSKKKLTLGVGKFSSIKAVTTLAKKNRKLSNEGAKQFRYYSSNEAVATVSSKGRIKAVGAGTCVIHVYAQNGLSKTIEVTVN